VLVAVGQEEAAGARDQDLGREAYRAAEEPARAVLVRALAEAEEVVVVTLPGFGTAELRPAARAVVRERAGLVARGREDQAAAVPLAEAEVVRALVVRAAVAVQDLGQVAEVERVLVAGPAVALGPVREVAQATDRVREPAVGQVSPADMGDQAAPEPAKPARAVVRALGVLEAVQGERAVVRLRGRSNPAGGKRRSRHRRSCMERAAVRLAG